MPMCLSNAQDARIVIAYAGVSVELTSHVGKTICETYTHKIGQPY